MSGLCAFLAYLSQRFRALEKALRVFDDGAGTLQSESFLVEVFFGFRFGPFLPGFGGLAFIAPYFFEDALHFGLCAEQSFRFVFKTAQQASQVFFTFDDGGEVEVFGELFVALGGCGGRERDHAAPAQVAQSGLAAVGLPDEFFPRQACAENALIGVQGELYGVGRLSGSTEPGFIGARFIFNRTKGIGADADQRIGDG